MSRFARMFSGVVLNYSWLTLIVFSFPGPSGPRQPRSCGLCVPIVISLWVLFNSRGCNSILPLCIKRAQTGSLFFGSYATGQDHSYGCWQANWTICRYEGSAIKHYLALKVELMNYNAHFFNNMPTCLAILHWTTNKQIFGTFIITLNDK